LYAGQSKASRQGIIDAKYTQFPKKEDQIAGECNVRYKI
jgi:hypothetical protein